MIQKKKKNKETTKSKKNISVMAVKYAEQAELVDPLNPLPNFCPYIKENRNRQFTTKDVFRGNDSFLS